ncbi:AAA family ATPase [Paenibacillus sp. Marseille-Q7038]
MFENFEIDDYIYQADASVPIVAMMCGVAGSGKTTIAQRLERRGFVRLSIDEEIWATNGRYGIDYPIEMYDQLKVKAELKLHNELVNLLNEKRNVVIDFSFWQRKRRNEYKKLIKDGGGEWRLIYLKVHPNELRERLRIRSQRFDANPHLQ